MSSAYKRDLLQGLLAYPIEPKPTSGSKTKDQARFYQKITGGPSPRDRLSRRRISHVDSFVVSQESLQEQWRRLRRQKNL